MRCGVQGQQASPPLSLRFVQTQAQADLRSPEARTTRGEASRPDEPAPEAGARDVTGATNAVRGPVPGRAGPPHQPTPQASSDLLWTVASRVSVS